MDAAFDCDGVLADFEKHFCKTFGNEYRHYYRLEDRYPKKADLIDIFVNTPGTYKNLDIVPTGFEIAKWCRSAEMTIHVVSGRPFFTRKVTEKWLTQSKVPYDKLSVDPVIKASKIISMRPVFVVEDMLASCMMYANLGIRSFLIDQPWNQSEKLPKLVSRLHSFDEFLCEVGELMKF